MIAFTTPPPKRPYSAEIPEVRIWVSWMASSTNRFCGVAKMLSLMSTPLIMNTLSNAKPPLITSCCAFGEFSVKAGASWAMPWIVRGVASRSISSCLKLAPTTGVAIGAGVSATTVTVSATPAGRIDDVLFDGQAEQHVGRLA